MKKSTILIIIIISLLIIGGGIFFYLTKTSGNLSKAEHEACLEKGGSISSYEIMTGNGPKEIGYCLPSDTGKECIQASDCEASCITNSDGKSNYTYNKDGFITGTCELDVGACWGGYDRITFPTKNITDLEFVGGVCI